MPEIKVYYFDFPGRGEATRLILTVGGIDFEDVRLTRETWPQIKPSTPFGQLPSMQVDGQWVAQAFALEQYAGALAKLIPSDPFEHTKALQALYLMDDAFQVFLPTFKMDEEAKLATRKELLEGTFGQKLQHMNKLLEGKTFFLGDDLSWVDLSIFCAMSLLRAGWLDGVPKTLLNPYPALKAWHANVANLPKVKAYYHGRTGLYEGYQVDA